MRAFVRVVQAISRLCGLLAAAMIAVSVLIVVHMVYVRYVLNTSTIWQTEFVTYLMIGATLIGMPYVQHLRGHVNVDLVPLYMSRRGRLALDVFTKLLVVVVSVVLAYYSGELWYKAWTRNWASDTVWGVRLWIPYAALPLGFGLMTLQSLADLARLALGAPPFDLPPGRGGIEQRAGH